MHILWNFLHILLLSSCGFVSFIMLAPSLEDLFFDKCKILSVMQVENQQKIWHFVNPFGLLLCNIREIKYFCEICCVLALVRLNSLYITKDSFWACRSREFFPLIFPPHPLFPGGINQIQTKIWSCQEEIGKETLENQSFPLNSLLKPIKYSY
jgi:hypothetical protein